MADNTARWSKYVAQSGKPAYLAIADAIAADMQAGRLAANENLPPLRALASELGLNYTTVARAYAEARRRGLVDARSGRGTFVKPASSTTAPVRSLGFVGLVEMTMNLPPEPQDPALMLRMQNGLAELQQRMDMHELLRYQDFGGTRADREAGIRLLEPHLPGLAPERVLVCPGVQSALLALISVLVRPGEVMCTEALTYPGAKAIASHLGVELVGLPLDAEGIDPEAFAAACAKHAPKALYLNPTLLNPTTAVMSEARRLAVAETARQHNVWIIEDDAYGLLPARAPRTIAELAPESTFYVSGLAKFVGAGLRIAYLAAPDARQAQRIATTLRAMTVMASPITTALSTRWIEDGTAHAILGAVREESARRQRLAAQALPAGSYASQPEAFHLWLALPPHWSRVEFAAHLRARGIGVVGSDSFAVTETPPQAVRVCLGGAVDRHQCRTALDLIAGVLEQHPAVASGVM
ncbi:MAG: PLP-dependent aminotransferase family protein [Betaproteobacteria bacterium]|nr:PLP-dependent aminotransferase family protein [Betaproteobacteria bacterium]